MAARFVFLGHLPRNVNIRLLSGPKWSWQGLRSLQTTAPLSDTIKLKMPSLSPTMYEGTIVQWHKKEGDTIVAGDVICDIQTDKAVVGLEMDDDGVLAKILKPDNSRDVKIGTLIALIAEEGDDWKNIAIPPDDSVEDGAVISAESSSTTQSSTTHGHHTYGPAVRNLLDQYSINVADVQGSGPHSRILKGDLLHYIKEKNLQPITAANIPLPQPAASKPAAPAQPAVIPPPPAAPRPQVAAVTHKLPEGTEYVDVELTNMRKIIAKRLTESKISTPHAYSTIDCNITPITQLRKEFASNGTKVSVNDFIVKAAAVTLQRVPEVNALWTEDGGQVVANIDISVAVATDNGLITPIVQDAIGLGVEEISHTVRELAGRAREGRLKPEEYQGGTFTISNLGMFGISEFTAIINPPQACIMAVGTSRVELDLNAKPQTFMTVTLSSDARLVNEFLANRFLETFKEIMENPMLMLSQGPKIDMQKLFAK